MGGCISAEFEAVINDNGSGIAVSRLDMSRLYDVMEQMGKDPAKDKDLSRIMDTFLNVKDQLTVIESKKGRALTADEKEVYSASTLHIKMDYTQKLLYLLLTAGFRLCAS